MNNLLTYNITLSAEKLAISINIITNINKINNIIEKISQLRVK